MRVTVLGSAAGGGFPQWNCACPNCSRLRAGNLRFQARSQAQVVVCPNAGECYLLNASPDLRAQIVATPLLTPGQPPRNTPIAGVLLTSADVDSIAGLLHLREFQPLHIYSTLSVRRIVLEENRIFRVLNRANPPAIWHVPLSGAGGLLEMSNSGMRGRRVLIHINNTNPILDEESSEYREVRDAGWEIAYDGMEFEL